MGRGMARSLLREGHAVRAWNRTREEAEPLGDDGATVVDTAAEAVDGADAVPTMLFDADAVASTMADALPKLAPEAVWLQTSTVGVDDIDRLAVQAREGDFEPSFALDGVLKDTHLILDAAHGAGTFTGLLAMLADRLASADRAATAARTPPPWCVPTAPARTTARPRRPGAGGGRRRA